jgi:hypothetical protein
MSLSYLLSRETYHTQFNWDETTAQGVALLTIPLRPNYFQTVILGPPVSTLAGPLGYLSNFFYYYHGSIRLTLRFAKTERHQGRIAVVFYPGNLTADPGYSHIAYAPQEVIDISTGSEWTFTFPYTSQQYYTKMSDQYGLMVVYVVNELTGDSTVANNVDCLIYVSADPEFEYAFPRVNNGAIVSPGVDAPAPPVANREPAPRGGGDEIIRCKSAKFQRKHVHVTVGNTQTTPQGTEYAGVCIGERVLSLKQLLLVPCEVTFLETSLDPYYEMRAFTIGVTTDNTAAGTAEWAGDRWSQFAPLYAFSRGGMVLHFICDKDGSEFQTWVQPNFNLDTASFRARLTAPGSSTSARKAFATNKYLSLYVPQYSQNQCRLNRVSTWRGGVGVPEPVDQYSAQTLTYLECRTGAFTGFPHIYRAAADDTQLGFFLGVPPYNLGSQSTLDTPVPAPLAPVSATFAAGEEALPPNPPCAALDSPSLGPSPQGWGRKTPATSQDRNTTGPQAKAGGETGGIAPTRHKL